MRSEKRTQGIPVPLEDRGGLLKRGGEVHAVGGAQRFSLEVLPILLMGLPGPQNV